MVYYAFEPRQSIIDKISTSYDVDKDGTLESCVTVTGNRNNIIYIPLYFSEEVKSESLPEMPYGELRIVSVEYEPHDIGASTRKMEAYIDLHIYFTNIDGISRKTFAEKIKDKLQDEIRTNQCSFTNITFININSDTYVIEEKEKQTYFHYICTIYCLYYDLC